MTCVNTSYILCNTHFHEFVDALVGRLAPSLLFNPSLASLGRFYPKKMAQLTLVSPTILTMFMHAFTICTLFIFGGITYFFKFSYLENLQKTDSCLACLGWPGFFFFFFRYCAGQRYIAALSHTGGQARKN